jgi:hypothetical protein
MDRIMRGRRRPRTLRSFVLRAVVPRLVAFLGIAAMVGVGQAMAVSPSAEFTGPTPGAALQPVPQAAPAWTPADAQAFPGCRPAADWPTGTPAAYVVVHSFREDRHRRMAFDAAWRANHDETEADDVWVIGVCGRP